MIICCTCSKKHEQQAEKNNETVSNINQNETNVYSTNDNRLWAYIIDHRTWEIKLQDFKQDELPKEVKGIGYKDDSITVNSNDGITCLTNVIDNNVNVRNYPSLESEVISQVHNNDIVRIIGFSGEKMNIDNFYGEWLNILYQKNEKEYINGWIFSKYLNIKDIEYTPIQFYESILNPYSARPYTGLGISYTLQDKEIFDFPDYTEWNDYYIIVRSVFDNYYHYTNKPGIYTFDKRTHEFKHITYMGSYGPTAHAWTVFTDDFKYLIQDSGTSPGVRGITVWRLSDMKIFYNGGYYGKRENIIKNNTIEVVYRIDNWRFEHGYIDEEVMQFGKNFIENNPITQEMLGNLLHPSLSYSPLVRATVNLDTGERILIKGEYIVDQ
jgi:hypothetical protein